MVGYKRDKHQSDFLGSAEIGKCASRHLEYFGYKLVAATTLFGIPIFYDLVPANTDEHLAAESVLNHFVLCDIFSDKGFIGLRWQTQIFEGTSNLIWTPRRFNQRLQNSRALDRFLSSIRERIEGVFHEIQDVGRNIEHLLSNTILSLMTRVIAKITSHVHRHILLVDFGVNV